MTSRKSAISVGTLKGAARPANRRSVRLISRMLRCSMTFTLRLGDVDSGRESLDVSHIAINSCNHSNLHISFGIGRAFVGIHQDVQGRPIGRNDLAEVAKD